jgi:hypothetical protein
MICEVALKILCDEPLGKEKVDNSGVLSAPLSATMIMLCHDSMTIARIAIRIKSVD